jgi:hypothetical protein
MRTFFASQLACCRLLGCVVGNGPTPSLKEMIVSNFFLIDALMLFSVALVADIGSGKPLDSTIIKRRRISMKTLADYNSEMKRNNWRIATDLEEHEEKEISRILTDEFKNAFSNSLAFEYIIPDENEIGTITFRKRKVHFSIDRPKGEQLLQIMLSDGQKLNLNISNSPVKVRNVEENANKDLTVELALKKGSARIVLAQKIVKSKNNKGNITTYYLSDVVPVMYLHE